VPTDLQLTDRTRETRDKLLRTARSIFEREGYDATSISSIVEAAEVSRGTFYLYFQSKEDIFRTLAEEIQADLVGLQAWPRKLRPEEVIERSIATFMVFYRDNARMMAVLEQVATYDPGFRALRRQMRRSVADRAVRFIRDLQRKGVVDADVDPRIAGIALTGMVDRFAYVWHILDEDFDEDAVVRTLTRLWFQAIGGHLDGLGAADGAGTPG
jgi:AcrR family transcriptional regulator